MPQQWHRRLVQFPVGKSHELQVKKVKPEEDGKHLSGEGTTHLRILARIKLLSH